jgi:deazaflavin-dependent oxidoreductase (nitroreductase family)
VALDADQMAEPYCYLTTTGRVSGNPHTIEIWFGHATDHPNTVYLMSGGRDRSDWVRNLLRQPRVSVRIGNHTWEAEAHVLEPDTEEDALARGLLFDKYQEGYGRDLSNWRDTSLPVAIELG